MVLVIRDLFCLSMASCTECKIPLIQGDDHLVCLRHRSCSRMSPCELDINKPAEHWDTVEALQLAIKQAPRKSGRVSSKSRSFSKGGKTKSQLGVPRDPTVATTEPGGSLGNSAGVQAEGIRDH